MREHGDKAHQILLSLRQQATDATSASHLSPADAGSISKLGSVPTLTRGATLSRLLAQAG
ncbi:MAG TPA: hypothetical protein VGC91_07310 [Pyrinomonadaceae bacterium]